MDKLLRITERVQEKCVQQLAVTSKPTKLEDAFLFGKRVESLKEWLLDGKTDVAFLFAPCGSGSTTLVHLVAADLGVEICEVDHVDKDFQKLLAESNKSTAGFVLLDGFDSHVGKRTMTIFTDHLKTSRKKTLCVGHSDGKSSSSAFSKKWVSFDFSPERKMLPLLQKISSGRVPNDVLDRIVRASGNDIRGAVNSVEMYIHRPGELHGSDDFVCPIESLEKLFAGTCSLNVVARTFEHEPFVLSGGVFDNYLRSIKTMEDATTISENLCNGDVFSTDYSCMDYFSACAAGYINACTAKKRIKVGTYGLSNSKNSNMMANKKKLSAVNVARAKVGKTYLRPEDIGLSMNSKLKKPSLITASYVPLKQGHL
ncbi:replication factor C [Acanthocystis turfacea Chlorella virus MN0810.1]|nr:replication factor C [Acanthocystis turfacea Chlorella virus MN0810.1]